MSIEPGARKNKPSHSRAGRTDATRQPDSVTTNGTRTGQKRKHTHPGNENPSDLPRPKKHTHKPNTAATTHTDDITSTKNAAWDDKYCKLRPGGLVELFAQTIKKYQPELADLEVEDRGFPAQTFEDCTDFTGPRSIRNLKPFLEVYAQGGVAELSSCSGSVGSPHTIVVSPSAMRCMDVKRAVDQYGGEENKIAKLFSKHIKYQEARNYVEKTAFGLAVGTPGRVEELITGRRIGQQQRHNKDADNDEEDEAQHTQQSRLSGGVLKLDCLKRIVLDASYQDEKKRGLLNDEAAFTALISLLNVEALKLRLVSKETQILVF